ncbi:MAG: histone deacetylase family protein [Pseudomonadota bacterium]
MSKRTAFITHDDCLKHEMGAHHPERPERLIAIKEKLKATELQALLIPYEAPLVKREYLTQVHTESYVTLLESSVCDNDYVQLNSDTAMNPYTLSAAKRAAGAAVLAVDLVMSNEVDNAFCGIRPPGHHAVRNDSMGFCFFNNIAVAAAYAMNTYHLKRIAILDFDVHHGNGTEDIFHHDSRVLFCSTFQFPLYPGSGVDSGNEHIINTPLKSGATGKDFREAVKSYWLPALEIFKPELIFISAGFDAHRDDHLASLNLLEEDYEWVTQEIKGIADQYCQSRIVSVLEGGYNLKSLADSVAIHLRALIA